MSQSIKWLVIVDNLCLTLHEILSDYTYIHPLRYDKKVSRRQ